MAFAACQKNDFKLQTAAKSSPSSRMERIFFDIHCSKLKENIDTNTPQGRFVLSIFAALSELEREQTLQRQREGIAIAKTQGKYKGRQPLPIDWVKFGQLYQQWKSGNITAVDFQKQMELQANTFYRRIREYKRKIT